MDSSKNMDSPKTPKNQMIPTPSTPNAPKKQVRFIVSSGNNATRNLSDLFTQVATKK